MIILNGWELGGIVVSALSIGAVLGLVVTSILVSGTREPVDETGTRTDVL
jgi:hypothetical protein